MADESKIEQVSEVKTKKKFVFAKDRNQAILAVVVVIVFFANTTYAVLKFNREQSDHSSFNSLLQQATDAQAGVGPVNQ